MIFGMLINWKFGNECVCGGGVGVGGGRGGVLGQIQFEDRNYVTNKSFHFNLEQTLHSRKPQQFACSPSEIEQISKEIFTGN